MTIGMIPDYTDPGEVDREVGRVLTELILLFDGRGVDRADVVASIRRVVEGL